MFIASIVYLSSTQPAIAPIFTAAMLPFIIGIVGTIQRTEAGVQQSADNNVKIAQLDTKVAIVDTKVDGNTTITEETNKMADGRLSAALDEIRSLNASVRRLETSAAVKATEAAHAESSEARIIAAVQNAVPASVETVGSTPAHGTTIAPAGPTTIIVDPSADVTIVKDSKA